MKTNRLQKSLVRLNGASADFEAVSHHTNIFMNHQAKRSLIAALVFASASFARADLVTFDSSVVTTLHTLGTDFIIGCTVLAVGIIVAGVISRKK